MRYFLLACLFASLPICSDWSVVDSHSNGTMPEAELRSHQDAIMNIVCPSGPDSSSVVHDTQWGFFEPDAPRIRFDCKTS